MLKGFAKDNGINVTLRNGSDFELANQIVQEGSASPADVFLTENSPAMTLVSDKGLFAPLDEDTMAQVPAAYVSSKKDWIGFAARSTVLAYNTKSVPTAQLPASIMDMADPRWKGQVGIAPSGADFQAIVSAVVAVEGQSKAQAWLEGARVQRQDLPQQRRDPVRGQRRARSGPGSSTTTTGTRTRPSPAPTARTCSWSSSATRTRVRSCPPPAPACSSRASTPRTRRSWSTT
jgi:hypothetical protein